MFEYVSMAGAIGVTFALLQRLCSKLAFTTPLYGPSIGPCVMKGAARYPKNPSGQFVGSGFVQYPLVLLNTYPSSIANGWPELSMKRLSWMRTLRLPV